MSKIPWFTNPSMVGDEFLLGDAELCQIPSGEVRIDLLDSLELGRFPAPSGTATVRLVCRSGNTFEPANFEARVRANSIANSFEERGAPSLPRYEPLASPRHNVGAVLVGLMDDPVERWELANTVGNERLVGRNTVWVTDANAHASLGRLADETTSEGKQVSFYVRRTTLHQEGVGVFSHSDWSGLLLNVAQSESDDPVDGQLRIWLGRAMDDRVAVVAIDLAPGTDELFPALWIDPWRFGVLGGLEVSERADLTSLVHRVDPFWVPAYFPGKNLQPNLDDPRYQAVDDDGEIIMYPPDARVRFLGQVPLAGHLQLGMADRDLEDGYQVAEDATKLGLVADPGVYPVFMSAESESSEFAILIRFAPGIPARWSYAPGVVDSNGPWPGRGVALMTDSTPSELRGVSPIREHPIRWNGTGSGAVVIQPKVSFMSNAGVCEVYVGYDSSDAPVAVVIDVVNMVAADDTYVDSVN